MPGPSHSTRMLYTAWRVAANCTCYSKTNSVDHPAPETWYEFQIQDAGISVLINEAGKVEIHDGQRCLQQNVDYEEKVIGGQTFYQVNSSALNGTRIVFQINGNGVELFRLKEKIEA